MIPDRHAVQNWLGCAIQSAYEHDAQLFREAAHERSIVFHIARRLAAMVDVGLSGWAVDVEYDRQHLDHMKALKKKLHGLGSPTDEVCPDLILHRRDGCSAEHNLLVVEAKKAGSRRRKRELDLLKLRLFTEAPFSYRYAVFLEFAAETGQPSWLWVSDPADSRSMSVVVAPCLAGNGLAAVRGIASPAECPMWIESTGRGPVAACSHRP